MNEKGTGKLLSRFHHVGVVVKNVDEATEYIKVWA